MTPWTCTWGDEVIFRVERSRATIAKTPNFLELAGAVAVPAGKRGTPWDEVLRRTRHQRARREPDRIRRHQRPHSPPDWRPPDLAARATALLASGERLLLADLILAECVYVLESFYEVDRPPSCAAHAFSARALHD